MAVLTTLQRWGWIITLAAAIVLGLMFWSAASELADERAIRRAAEDRIQTLIDEAALEHRAAVEEQAARVELEAQLKTIATERAKVEAETAARLEELASVPDDELAAYVNEWIEGLR